MDQVEFQFVGGPADGETETVAVGKDGMPPRYRAYTKAAVWASALDDQPVTPAETHRYQRGDGPPWRYQHLGQLT